MPHRNHWPARLENTAFSFRGYNVENLGRTPELLEHPAYGAIVRDALAEASAVCAETIGRKVDLVARVRNRQETTGLATYAEDVALIVAVEMAQLRLLQQFFGVSLGNAKLVFGYSLGEAAALIATGVYALPDLLRLPLLFADDCVELAHDVTMGVLFSRGATLDTTAVERLCLQITQQGKGVLAISTYLAPNTLLLLGQGGTVDECKVRLQKVLPEPFQIRKNQHRWPPMHTPIMWQRCVSDRAAVQLQTLPGGFVAPKPPIISGVTGRPSYTDHNSRELMHLWVDHPQRLWDVVYHTLASGVDVVVHVGPSPNLIPATFKRLSDNVQAQLAGRGFRNFSLRTVSRIVRRPWLNHLLARRTALLRAPFVEHIILEDWLLEQKVA
jgi:[acyl-carrier-protein] S-malonyltransferase